MIKEKDLNHVVFFILLHRNLMRAKLQAVPNAILTQVRLENTSKRFMDMSFMLVKGIRVTIMTLPRVIPWMEAILTLQEHHIVSPLLNQR